jgi:hypothetical protein
MRMLRTGRLEPLMTDTDGPAPTLAEQWANQTPAVGFHCECDHDPDEHHDGDCDVDDCDCEGGQVE